MILTVVDNFKRILDLSLLIVDVDSVNDVADIY